MKKTNTMLNHSKIINIIIVFLILSCDSLKDSVTYFFPTRMDVITKTEIDSMCEKQFFLKSVFSNDEKFNKIKFDSVVFKKNGEIYSSNLKVGKWNSDRNIYLSNYGMNFYFNSISNNNLKIYSRYTSKNDTLLKQIRIILISKNKKQPINLDW